MSAELSLDAPTCPKCGQRRLLGTTACPRCGLVFARWRPDNASAWAQLDAQAEALWARVEAGWQDPARHDAFLKYCSVAGLLAAAGRRYRERLDRMPGDELAAQMQERVLAMATASFSAARPQPPPPVTRTVWFWAVILLSGVMGMVFFFLMQQ